MYDCVPGCGVDPRNIAQRIMTVCADTSVFPVLPVSSVHLYETGFCARLVFYCSLPPHISLCNAHAFQHQFKSAQLPTGPLTTHLYAAILIPERVGGSTGDHECHKNSLFLDTSPSNAPRLPYLGAVATCYQSSDTCCALQA